MRCESRQWAMSATRSSYTIAFVGSVGRSPAHHLSQSGGVERSAVCELFSPLCDRCLQNRCVTEGRVVLDEGCLPPRHQAADAGRLVLEILGGEFGEFDLVGVVDGREKVPWELSMGDDSGVAGEADGCVADGVVESGDDADIVPIASIHAATNHHPTPMSFGQFESLGGYRRVDESGIDQLRGDCPHASESADQFSEVAGVGQLCDAVDVGLLHGDEVLGSCCGEGRGQVGFGVVDVLGGERYTGGMRGLGDGGGLAGGGVEVGGVASARERDVGGFSVETGRTDHVDVVAGDALSLVDGGGVAVIDGARKGVFGVESDLAMASRAGDVDGAGAVVDASNRGDHPVVDAASMLGVEVDLAACVGEQNDAVADLE